MVCGAMLKCWTIAWFPNVKINFKNISNINYLSRLALAFICFKSTVKMCSLCSLTVKCVFSAVTCHHHYFLRFWSLGKCNWIALGQAIQRFIAKYTCVCDTTIPSRTTPVILSQFLSVLKAFISCKTNHVQDPLHCATVGKQQKK